MALNVTPNHTVIPPTAPGSKSEESHSGFSPQRSSVSTLLPGILDTAATDGDGYLGWGMTVAIKEDMGLRGQAPAGAARSAPVDFVRIHTGIATMIVQAVAVRVGKKPKMPSFKAPSANEVLLDRNRVLFNPARLPDGTPLFGVAVEYVFGMQLMYGDDDEVPFPGDALSTYPAGTYALNPIDYSTYLLASRPVSGFQGQAIAY